MKLEVDSKRTADQGIYTQENRYDQPKEITRVITQRLLEQGDLAAEKTIMDVGTANGEFLYHVAKHAAPDCKLMGLELLPDLVAKARQKVSRAEIVQGSILDARAMPEAIADVVLVQGVITIFDDFKAPLRNALSWVRPGGKLIVFGHVNPDPLDVIVRYRASDAPESAPFESGWNVFSLQSFERFFKKEQGCSSFSFTPFNMGSDLAKNSDDPARSWTFRDADGKRQFVNGLSLLLHMGIIEVKK